ncbi:MAG: MarR family transcriptional regulator [Actinobacteria bacterium]|nr:MarR family transcriptional regulator [Actinomycetota bacterium]
MSDSSILSTERTISQGATAAAGANPLGTCSPHHEAWRALARTHAAVSGRLQDALAQAELPPLAWFEMLAAIAAAERQAMRMGDLAEALVITRGGLTKLVDRLVKAGLVERTFCDTDRRVSYATLLPAGAELLEEMVPVVSAELELAFAARLTEHQADELRATLDSVRGSACSGD